MPLVERSNTATTFLKRHPVAIFFFLTFLISWGGVFAVVGPSGLPGTAEEIDRLYGDVVVPMLFAPLLAAIVVSAYLSGWAGVKRLLQGIVIWRAKPIEYAALFLLIPVCALTVLMAFSTVSTDYTPKFLDPENGLQTVFLFLALGFVIGLIEETGWTGFAISRLWRGGAILPLGIGFGVIHGIWHFLVAYWLEGADFGILIIPFLISLWLVALVTMRILIVWVFSRTGSTLLAAMAHASHTGWLYALWPQATTPQQDVIWTTAFAALGLVAVFTLVHFTSPDDRRNISPSPHAQKG